MRNLRHYRYAAVITTFAIVAVLCLFGLITRTTPSPVQCATISANAVLSGSIQWVEEAPRNCGGFSYAILFIDGEAKSINNALPLRFDLDTTKLTNGRHTIDVAFYDQNCKIAQAPQTPVIIANRLAPVCLPTTPATKTIISNVATVIPLKPISVANNPEPPAQLNNITIYYHDKSMNSVLSPYVERRRAMALLRPLTIAAGGTLEWVGESGTTVIKEHTVRFTLNSRYADIDGKRVRLVRPTMMRQDRVYAPVSLWHDIFHGETDYIAKTHSVYLGEINIPTVTARIRHHETLQTISRLNKGE